MSLGKIIRLSSPDKDTTPGVFGGLYSFVADALLLCLHISTYTITKKRHDTTVDLESQSVVLPMSHASCGCRRKSEEDQMIYVKRYCIWE